MDPARSEGAAVVLVLGALLLSGPVGLFAPAPTPSVGDGDAAVTVVAPTGDELPLTPGRFGTDVSYLRLPDLVAEVRDVTGSPELVYRISVPALGVEERVHHVLGRETDGRVRLDLDHRGLPRDALSASEYEGRIIVRVQSFETERTIVNRSIQVVVDG